MKKKKKRKKKKRKKRKFQPNIELSQELFKALLLVPQTEVISFE